MELKKIPNWELFSNTIQLELKKCPPLDNKNIEKIVDNFTEIIHNTRMNIIKKSTVEIKNPYHKILI